MLRFLSNRAGICAVLAALTLVVFVQTARFDFIDIDDDVYVRDNPHLRGGFTRDNVRWAFTADLSEPSPQVDYWQPITILSRLIDVQLFGMRPGGYHLMNVFFHIGNVMLLFLFLYRIGGRMWLGAAVAAAFAVHPLRVESVAWVVERKDVLSGIFWWLTLLAYARYAARPGKKLYAIVVLTMALGLMAKPVLITMPIIFLMLDVWPLNRISDARQDSDSVAGKVDFKFDGAVNWGRLRHLLIEKIPFFALSIVSCWATFRRGQTPFPGSTPFVQLLAAPVAYIWYLWKLFWPVHLAAWYPHVPGTLSPPWQIVGSAGLLAVITALVLNQARSRPYLAFGWFWFLVTMAPMVLGCTFVLVADRFTYIPYVGLMMMIAWAATEAVDRKQWNPKAVFTGTAVVLCAFAGLSAVQTARWKNSVTLFEYVLTVTRDNFAIQTQLGKVLADHGDLDGAINHYEQAIASNPNVALTRYNCGNALLRKGRPRDAVDQYREAIRLAPNTTQYHINLGAALYETGRSEEAVEEFESAMRLAPDQPEILHNLAWIFATDEDTDIRNPKVARGLAERAAMLTQHRDPVILDMLATAYAADGRFDEAAAILMKTIDTAEHTGNTAYLPIVRYHLQLYQARLPYRNGPARPNIDSRK